MTIGGVPPQKKHGLVSSGVDIMQVVQTGMVALTRVVETSAKLPESARMAIFLHWLQLNHTHELTQLNLTQGSPS